MLKIPHRKTQTNSIGQSAYGGLLLIILLGCSSTTSALKVKKPLAKLNPTPSQGYEITVQLANAPQFLVASGGAQFNGVNAGCKQTQYMSGAVSTTQHDETIKLTKVSETLYRGIVYTDQLLDENYFGRGLCHWELSHFGVSFSAAPNKQSTNYTMSLNEDLVKALKADTRYFWKGYYPRATMEGFVDIGDQQLSEDVRRQHGDEFFSITLSSKKLAP